MQKVFLISLLIIQSLTAARLFGQTHPASKTEPSFKYVLLTSQSDVDWAFTEKHYRPIKLTSAQLDTVKSIIKRVSDSLHLLITSTNVNTRVVDTLKHAYQIVSAINNKGELYLLVNAICEPDKDWERRLIFVDDGGSRYYKFRIDLKTKQYFDIEINASG